MTSAAPKFNFFFFLATSQYLISNPSEEFKPVFPISKVRIVAINCLTAMYF